MCGRFASKKPPAELQRLYGTGNLINFPARFNAAPMQEHAVIIRDRMGLARWGFLPPWAQEDDKSLAAKLTNARSETVAEKPTFRDAWGKGRRCLIPVDGFYEWHRTEDKAPNQPYFVYRDNDKPMAMAGLWGRAGDLVTFTVLTKDATAPINAIHHRMPVMFDPAQAQEWFSASPMQALAMMQEAAVNDICHHPVGFEVGKVANDSEELMQPVKVASGMLF